MNKTLRTRVDIRTILNKSLKKIISTTLGTGTDYKNADYIIAMDGNNLRNIERLVGKNINKKVYLLLDFTERKGESIADPWYTGNFDVTYEDIKEGCEGLAEFLKKKSL